MGSFIVKALVEQIGQISTNQGSSNPIEQKPNPFGTSSPTLIEQDGPLKTAESTPGQSTSNPVLQFKPPVANAPPDSQIVLQVSLGSGGSSISVVAQDYAGPVVQLGLANTPNFNSDTSATHPIEQRSFSRKTDANGTPIEQKPPAIANVNIEQINFIELIFPPCFSVKNPVDSNIVWRINDFGFPFDTNTLIFKVNGIEVQHLSNFSIDDLGTGLQLTYNPVLDFEFSEQVTVAVDIHDTAVPPNHFSASCYFFTVPDTHPPLISNAVPCGQSDVSTTAPVEFDVTDAGAGVDLSKLILSIEGLVVCSGITITQLPTVSGSSYHVKWEHPDIPFKYGSNVSVAVQATDLSISQNSSLFVCDFDVEQSNPPEFENFNPGPCQSFVDDTTGLTFEVYGDISGIDISTLEVRVDNTLRKVIVRPRVKRSE